MTTPCRFCGEVAEVLVQEAAYLFDFGIRYNTDFPPACLSCRRGVITLGRIHFQLQGTTDKALEYWALHNRFPTAPDYICNRLQYRGSSG